MKTQKQLKLIAIESFANSLHCMEIFPAAQSSEGLSNVETEMVSSMTLEFKNNLLARFVNTISKKSDKFAAKAADRAVRAEQKNFKLAEKAAKIQQKAEAKLAKDTLRAEKLAAKLEKLKGVKAPIPEDEMISAT